MDGGLVLAWAPAVIAVMSLVYAAAAYPAGRLQDRFGARPLCCWASALIAADLVLAVGDRRCSPSLSESACGACIWG